MVQGIIIIIPYMKQQHMSGPKNYNSHRLGAALQSDKTWSCWIGRERGGGGRARRKSEAAPWAS